MKTKTLILSLTICALCFVVDGFRYSKDESRSDVFGREHDDGNRSALSQKRSSTRNHSSSRAGQINGPDGEEKTFLEGGPAERDSDKDNEDGPPERGPSRRGPPGRGHYRRCPEGGPPNSDDDNNGNDDDKPNNYSKGPPRRGFFRRGPHSLTDDDESGNYERGPQRRGPPRKGPPSFNNEDSDNNDDNTDNYGNGPPRRMPHRYDNSERDGYKKTRSWQKPSDSNDGETINPGYDGKDGEEKNDKLRRG